MSTSSTYIVDIKQLTGSKARTYVRKMNEKVLYKGEQVTKRFIKKLAEENVLTFTYYGDGRCELTF